jgi:hypothetical protein
VVADVFKISSKSNDARVTDSGELGYTLVRIRLRTTDPTAGS